ncbi:hypothetical protein ScPMuIL_008901 [Solemya velum]
MAEAAAINEDGKRQTLPQKGKVENVCRQWLVHEDGAFAYKLQNEEIDTHYDRNRFHRRTVRADIPVAKVVQSDEEHRQQEERFEQLQLLKAQAEEDEKVAKKVMVDMMKEDQSQIKIQEFKDEEVAKLFQEKEKRRYERYIEKKKVKQLQKERERIEKSLEQTSQEARLLVRNGDETNANLSQAVGGLNLMEESVAGAPTHTPVSRVTPAGMIEDEGDFSDFMMVLPEHVDDQQKKIIQEMQDEEIARLIQEQEHKRTKAEIDKNKLRDIEEQDARLAKIIHEQEKLKSRKAKQKRQQRDEARRQQELQQMGDSINTPPSPLSPNQQSDTPEHHRLRRDSFMQSLANGPDSPQSPQSPSDQAVSALSSRQNSENLNLTARRNSENTNSSARTARQNSENLNSSAISRQKSPVQQSLSSPPARQMQHDNNTARQQSKSTRQSSSKNTPLAPPPAGRARLPTPDELPYSDLPEVERWLANSPNGSNVSSGGQSHGHSHSDRSHFSDHMLPSPSPPGSYHSEEDEQQLRYHGNIDHSGDPLYAVSNPLVGVTNPVAFNIATAIDPTYNRRQHEIDSDETEQKMPLPPLSQSLPVAGEIPLEWDPGLRGSLRRPKRFWNASTMNYRDTTRSNISMEDNFDDEGPVLSPWQPVQGQRRSTVDKGRRPKKQPPNARKGSCKQQ